MNPADLIVRLEQIAHELEVRQGPLEQYALEATVVKRQREQMHAAAFLKAKGSGLTVAEATAVATNQTALMGAEDEARYDALKRVISVLETQASIHQTLIKTNVRLSS